LKLIFFDEKAFQETSIGEFPRDWRISRISEVADINSRSTNPRKELVDSEFLYIDIDSIEAESGTIKTPKRVLGKNAPSRARRVVLENDIIMSTVRPYLKAFALIPKEYDRQICSTGFAVLTCRKEIMPYYLLSTLFSDIVISQCNMMMVGGQYPALNNSQVSNILIPLPPLLEQQGISKILTVVDLAIQKAQEIIVKTEYLKKGLMQRLLAEGIGHKEFKDTKIGKIPIQWEVAKFEEIIGMMSGQYFKYEEFCEEGVRCLKIDNVGFGEIVWKTTTCLPENYLQKFPELVLKAGDIVLALNRPIIDNKVKVGMLQKEDEPSILYQRVGKVFLKDQKRIDKLFLLFMLTGQHFKQQLGRSLIGTDQPYARTPVLLGMKVPLPPISEQREIAKIFSFVDRKLQLERGQKTKLGRIKQDLMILLLTGIRETLQ